MITKGNTVMVLNCYLIAAFIHYAMGMIILYLTAQYSLVGVPFARRWVMWTSITKKRTLTFSKGGSPVRPMPTYIDSPAS